MWFFKDPRVQERIKQARDRDIYGKALTILRAYGSYTFPSNIEDFSGRTSYTTGYCSSDSDKWLKNCIRQGVGQKLDDGSVRSEVLPDYTKIKCYPKKYKKHIYIFRQTKDIYITYFSGNIHEIKAFVPGDWEKDLDEFYKRALERLPEKEKEENQAILEERVREQEKRDMQNPLKRDWGL